jgi:hypothetical protein
MAKALTTLALLLALTGSALAQEASPREFFKHDYASAPGAKGGPAPVRGKAAGPQAGNRQQQRALPQAGRGAGLQRKMAVSVYVNSLDQAHLAAVLETVSRLVDSKVALVTLVVHVGDYRNVSEEQAQALKRRRVMLMPSSSVIAPVPVSVSPAWFIQTKEGGYVVEGVVNVDAMVNSFGEFDPKAIPRDLAAPELASF